MKDYMVVPVQIKGYEIKQEDSGEYAYVEGYASFYNNIDLGRDRVLPGFFTDDLKERGNTRPALWQHQQNQPVGVKIYTDDPMGLKFLAKLPMDDTMVTGRVLPQLKVGSIQGASIGYTTEISKYNQQENCRDLVKGTIEESSFVTFPMNPKACILSVTKYVKSSEKKEAYISEIARSYGIDEDIKTVPAFKDYIIADDAEWNSRKAIKEIREYTGSEETPSKTYKSGFMYYDPDKEDDFTGYKLPYVQTVKGEFRAAPRALAAIVGALSGARGGVDIPTADKKKIKEQINKYYKKMGREEPFKKDKLFIDSHTLKYMDIKSLDLIFDENTILSSKSRETIKTTVLSSFKGEAEQGGDLRKAIEELKTAFDK